LVAPTGADQSSSKNRISHELSGEYIRRFDQRIQRADRHNRILCWWRIFGYFATKEELRAFRDTASFQNKTLHCLLQKHVQLLEGKHKRKLSLDELVAILEDIQKHAPTSIQISENDIKKITRLEQQKEEVRTRIAAAERDVSEATNALMYRECEK